MTRAETLTAERDRMRGLLADFEAGRIPPTAMPSDAYQYYARINETNEELKAIRQQAEYERQFSEVRLDGYRDAMSYVASRGYGAFRDAESIEQLRAQAKSVQVRAASVAEVAVDRETLRYPALSQDDWLAAYRSGAAQAGNEFYFAEKRRHEFGHLYATRAAINQAPAPDVAYREALRHVSASDISPGVQRALAENEINQRFTAKMDWEMRQRPPMTQEQRANVETQVYRSIASDLQQERQQQSQRQSTGQGMRA